MKRLLLISILACMVAVVPAQQTRKTAVQRKTATTKKTATAKKATPQKKAASGKNAASAKKTAAGKKQPVTVKSLQNERKQVQQTIKEQERRLKANEQDVKRRLQNLMVLNNEIADKQRLIDTIRHDISMLDENIRLLENQLQMLGKELEDRKQRYQKSLRYMHRNRSLQSKMMFVFSASNFSQIYRRMRFVREYASYQQAQGEAVMAMQSQVTEAFNELSEAKKLKQNLLVRGEHEQKALENKQTEQQSVVTSLKKQQKTIQDLIDQQKKRDAELNARIDKMVAEEIERARQRAEAEAKRKAAEEEAARKREEARKRDEERRKAEAKAKASADAKKNTAASTKTTKKGSKTTTPASPTAGKKEPEVRRSSTATTTPKVSTEDQRLSGNFESNKGRLPMPIVGSYQIVNRFGVNAVKDVKGNISLDKKGIDIKGQPGASVQCIFDGKVTAIGSYAGTTIVIVSHGTYLSVYCDLASVSVTMGQKVSTRQKLGTVGNSGLMQFQLRRGSAKLNPESWLRR